MKEPAQLAASDSESLGELFESVFIELTLSDERERAGDGVGSAEPGAELRHHFGTAAQTWTKARFLGGRGGREEATVRLLRRWGRADGSAVDAGRGHAHEEAAIEARVTRAQGAVAGLVVEHATDLIGLAETGWRFSDMLL